MIEQPTNPAQPQPHHPPPHTRRTHTSSSFLAAARFLLLLVVVAFFFFAAAAAVGWPLWLRVRRLVRGGICLVCAFGFVRGCENEGMDRFGLISISLLLCS